MKNYNTEKMCEMIERLLNWNWTVDDFENEYSEFLLNKVPSCDLDERDYGFFEAVRERLEWTTPKLHEGEVEIGYIDHGGFMEWLRKQYERYLTKPEIKEFSAWDFSEKKA